MFNLMKFGVKSAILALGLVTMAGAPVLADEYIGGEISVDLNTDNDVAILAADIEVTGRAGSDFAALGAQITIDGTFESDFAVAGAQLYIAGEIEGDAAMAGADVTVLANILGDAAIFGAQVNLSGFVGGEMALGGEEVTLGASSVVTGPMEIKARVLEADGRVIGETSIEAEGVTLRGVFEGPVEIFARDVVIGPQAVITGPITVRSPTPPTIAEGAQIGGLEHIEENWDDSRVDNWDFDVEGLVLPSLGALTAGNMIVALMVGLVVAAVFPRSMARLSSNFRRRPLVSAGLGLISFSLTGLLISIVIMILTVTVVGLVLVPFFILAIPAIYYLAFLFGGVAVGDAIFNRSGERAKYWLRAVSLLTVLAVIGTTALIGEVGWFFLLLSWLLGWIVWFIGFGAWTLTIFERQPADPVQPQTLEGEAV